MRQLFALLFLRLGSLAIACVRLQVQKHEGTISEYSFKINLQLSFFSLKIEVLLSSFWKELQVHRIGGRNPVAGWSDESMRTRILTYLLPWILVLSLSLVEFPFLLLTKCRSVSSCPCSEHILGKRGDRLGLTHRHYSPVD